MDVFDEIVFKITDGGIDTAAAYEGAFTACVSEKLGKVDAVTAEAAIFKLIEACGDEPADYPRYRAFMRDRVSKESRGGGRR